MFGTVLTLIVTLMHLYVFRRAGSVSFLTDRISRKAIVGSGVVLWTIFLIGRFLGHGSTGFFAIALEFFGMNWMAVLFLTSVSLLAIDIFTGFGFLWPRHASWLRAWALVMGGILSVIALIQGLRPPVVRSYEVTLSALPAEMDGKALVVISDLHLGSLIGKQWLEKCVAQVQSQKPDMVILLGDIFEGHGQPVGELLPILRRLSAPLGVWTVLGNHEFHGGERQSGTSLMDEIGFHTLRNAWAEIRPGLILAGVDSPSPGQHLNQNNDSISQALAGRPSGATILLSHTPEQVDKAEKAGVGLMLSAHTHGGQIWPFSYLVRYRYPMLGGIYRENGMTVIVCRGTGTWGPRMRLWYPNEILRITLRKA